MVANRTVRKSILITGASSGLGRGMAKEFAARGRDLALCARNLDALVELKAELLTDHPEINVEVRYLDVLDYPSVSVVFNEFRECFGSLHRVVVNAGVGNGQEVGTGEFRALQKVAETNFVAALAQIDAAIEIFREQECGHLVVISSVSAFRGNPGKLATYAATKAAVATLAEGLRIEFLDNPDIRISTIYPGYIATPLNEGIRNAPFRVDVRTGCAELARTIEAEPNQSTVPRWPWMGIGFGLRHMPLEGVKQILGRDS